MTSTITRNPKERLELAFGELKLADALVNKRSAELEKAQNRANETSGLAAAAELAFNTVDAKYRVLSESVESAAANASPPEKEVAAAKAIFSQAEAIQKEIGASHAAMGKVVAAAEQFAKSAETAAGKLKESVSSLEDASKAAPRGHKADLRNAASPLRTQRNDLVRLLGTLQRNLKSAKDDLPAAPKLPGLTALGDEVRMLESERAAADVKLGAKQPAAAAADLNKLKADLNKLTADRKTVELAWLNAPEVERSAQADLDARKAALAEARAAHAAALEEVRKVTREFVEQIKVSEPDAKGWATAQATLKEDIPAGYVLRWEAGGAPVEPKTAKADKVRIDANELPAGYTDVVATLVRESEIP